MESPPQIQIWRRVAVVACHFMPFPRLWPYRRHHNVTIPPSPHPLGATHSFLFTNPAVLPHFPNGAWQHITVNQSCSRTAEAQQCTLMSKRYKLYTMSLPQLQGFQYVLYQDSKVHITPLGFHRLVDHIDNAHGEWALMIRHHECLMERQHGVLDEVAAAMHHIRYRRGRQQIDQFVQEHGDLPMGGIVHNTGVAIWNHLHPQVLAIQQFWHSATMRTVLCQIASCYTYHRFKRWIITLLFPQRGIAQWDRDTRTFWPNSMACALDAEWWARHDGGRLLYNITELQQDGPYPLWEGVRCTADLACHTGWE